MPTGLVAQKVALVEPHFERNHLVALANLARQMRKDCPYTKLGMGTGYASAKNVHVQNAALSTLLGHIPNHVHRQWWVNIMQQGDTTDWHTHSPGTHAAVYYVTPGSIQFDFGDVHCPAGTMIRFRSDMRHRVLPVQTNGERITYAFNYTE